jgi:hypothetical protein
VARLAARGELTDGEQKASRSIIDAAGTKNWGQARDLAYRLRDGQMPTAEDQERVAKRTVMTVVFLSHDPMKMGKREFTLVGSGIRVEAGFGFSAFSPKRTWSDLGSTHVEHDPVAPASDGEHEEETAQGQRALIGGFVGL